MTTYKTFADLATHFGPVMPSTKETESEYGPAIDPLPTKAHEGPRVFKRYVLPEQDPEDYTDMWWEKWKSDFTGTLVALASFFDFDERSQFDPIQFVDKACRGWSGCATPPRTQATRPRTRSRRSIAPTAAPRSTSSGIGC